MKSIVFFFKTSITGGITFFLPFVFLMIMLKHAVDELTRVVGPLAEKLGIATIAGKATILMLVIIIILVICFLGGLLMRLPQFKQLNEMVENNVMVLIPGYDTFKQTALQKIVRDDKGNEVSRTLVLLFDQSAWVPALKTEMHNGYCSYFFPSDASLKSGYVKILPMESVREQVIPFEQLKNVMSPDAKGVIALIGERKI
ncbi:MAG TPA: hypothetical protein PK228_06945 [Saprospiraceae bacterium]|nr:hypothetical protein [Saprospiraceae bacterium]